MKFYQENSHLRRIWIDFVILFERIFNNNKIFLEKLVIFCKVEWTCARRQLGIFGDFWYVNEDTPSFKMSPRNLLLQFVLGHAFSVVYRLDYGILNHFREMLVVFKYFVGSDWRTILQKPLYTEPLSYKYMYNVKLNRRWIFFVTLWWYACISN